MKKSIIIGIILLCSGLVIFSSAMYFMDWNFENLTTVPKYEVKSKEVSADKSIVLDDDNVSVYIEKSSDDKIHLTYYENGREYYEFNELNDTLKISKKKDYKWYYYIFNINFQFPKFKISVPENYIGSLNVTTSNSEIELKDIKSEKIDVKTTNNSIKAENLIVNKSVKLSTSNGRINAESVKSDEFSAFTSNAKINLEKVSALGGVRLDTSNGAVSFKDIKATELLSVKTSNGRIEFSDILSDNISLKTSNAKVQGSILGKIFEYSINSKTSNAENNLPPTMNYGSKTLDVDTSNGDIDISFE